MPISTEKHLHHLFVLVFLTNDHKPKPIKHQGHKHTTNHSHKNTNSLAWLTAILVVSGLLVAYYLENNTAKLPKFTVSGFKTTAKTSTPDLASCYKTCSISLVESVPQNLTISKHPLPSTFEAWQYLITNARNSIDVAAYKSSLRGKHVLGPLHSEYSTEGDLIFDELESAGLERNIHIRVVENSPSKDKGDNADGRSLHHRGAIERRSLNLQKIYSSGIMHSKFIVSDEKDFYLGSANLDWRSLNQKLEMGVLVRNCPCLAKELTTVFSLYWRAAEARTKQEFMQLMSQIPPLSFNMQHPLRMRYEGVDTDVYIATSPKLMNAREQTWDLDAIVHEIQTAEQDLYIHVMDYFPMFLYSPNKEFWPKIDNAIRDAILRGVHVKIIAAALHYPKIGLNFLKSLELINEISKRGSVEIKIFKVPTPSSIKLLQRERRTHKKFLVTHRSAIIGTSNWSADYFEGIGTGQAIVVQQNTTGPQPFIKKMKGIFMRDWTSSYAYTLSEYYNACVASNSSADFCETEKDISFLENAQTAAMTL